MRSRDAVAVWGPDPEVVHTTEKCSQSCAVSVF
jgi:hypothetical protein